MAGTPKKFAMQQVLNLLLRKPSDLSIIAYLTDLKTSGLENTMEMVYPTGGKGNVYIGAGFAHSKRATLNVEVATWNVDVMAAQNGTEIVTGATDVVEYDIITLTTDSDTALTKYTAEGTAGSEIGFVYILDDDGTTGTTYTQSSGVSTGLFTYSSGSKTITLPATLTAGTTLVCSYTRKTSATAKKMSLRGDSIPATVLVTGYGVVVDICSNEAYLCQFNGKAQIDGNYSFDLSADGDPAIQSLNLEFVRDCNVEELYNFIIYEDDD